MNTAHLAVGILAPTIVRPAKEKRAAAEASYVCRDRDMRGDDTMKLRVWRILVAALFVIPAAVVQAQEQKQESAPEQTQEQKQQSELEQAQAQAQESQQVLEQESSFWDKSVTFGAEAWEATKEVSADAWQATKETSGDVWDATKTMSVDAWEATKELAGSEEQADGQETVQETPASGI